MNCGNSVYTSSCYMRRFGIIFLFNHERRKCMDEFAASFQQCGNRRRGLTCFANRKTIKLALQNKS